MSNDRIREVRKGDRPSAGQMNAIITRIEGMDVPNVSATAATLRMSPGTNDNLIKIKNTTGRLLFKMNVVSIETITNEPRENDKVNYLDGVVFVAVPPDREKSCALCVEAIKPGEIGLAMIYGCYQAKVQMNDPEDKFARVVDDDVSCLESCASGPFSLVWRTESEPAHAFVQFPAAVAGQNSRYVPPHSHWDHSDGGISVACFAPGTSVPRKPW